MRRMLSLRPCYETKQIAQITTTIRLWFSSDKKPPPDVQDKSTLQSHTTQNDKTTDKEKLQFLSKEEQPYRPIQGVNAPYEKIPLHWNKFIFKNMKSCEEIENAVYELWDRLTMREVEAAFHALKRLNAYPPASLLDGLAKKTIELADTINCRHVASIFLSLARVKYFNPGLFNCMALELMKPEKLQDTIGIACGTIIYSIGALQRYFERSRPQPIEGKIELFFPLQLSFIDTLVRRIMTYRDEDGLSNKNISNFMYGLAMMKYRFKALLNLLAEEAARPERLAIYNEQEVSNIVYSMGVLNYCHDHLLSQLCQRMLDSEWLETWSEQGLSNAVYGFSLIDYQPPTETILALVWEICREHRLAKYHNQHLMNLIHGLAIIGAGNIRVFRSLLDELLLRRHKFEFMLTGLASVVYSFAKAAINVEGLKILLKDLTFDGHIHQLGDQSLCNLIFAIGKLGDDEELLPFMQKLMREAVDSQRLSRYTERHVAHILYGLGKTRYHAQIDPICLEHMIQGVRSTLPTSTNQGLANVVYALALMGYLDREIHDRLCTEALNRMDTLSGISLASLVYSWGRISYRNEGFLKGVALKISVPSAMDEYTEHVLSNLLFGLHRMGMKDRDVFHKIIAQIRRPTIIDRFVYVTSPACILELLRADWVDESFKQMLVYQLKLIIDTRGNEQLPKQTM